jgi:hypothetical protein
MYVSVCIGARRKQFNNNILNLCVLFCLIARQVKFNVVMNYDHTCIETLYEEMCLQEAVMYL